MLEKIESLVYSVGLGIILLLIICVFSKLAYDLWRTPNIFVKQEVKLEQTQIDEMCVAWWFDSDLGSAKKRVCGK